MRENFHGWCDEIEIVRIDNGEFSLFSPETGCEISPAIFFSRRNQNVKAQIILWQIVGFIRQQCEIYDVSDDQSTFFFSIHLATWITTRVIII